MKEIVQSISIYFRKYLANYKKQLIIILILLLASIGISIILPLIVSVFIDNLEVEKGAEFFNILALSYLLLVLFKIVVEVFNAYLSERLGWTISNTLRSNLVSHCVGLDFTFHSKHKTGEMIERVDGDVTFLSNFFSAFFVNIVGNTIFVISIIIIFYIESGLIGIAYSLIAVLAYCSILLIQRKIMVLWTKYREDEAQLYGYIQESVSAREDIIGIGEVDYLKLKLQDFLRKIKRDYRKAMVISNIPTSSFFGLLNIGDLVAIGIGVFLFYKGNLSIGSVYLISNYVGLLNRPFIALRYEFESMQKVGASLNRITELFSIKSILSEGDLKIETGQVAIKLEHVIFRYQDTELPALNDISFEVTKGEKVGIVGTTGSGKSTLIRLIAKMYDAVSGRILINGVDVRHISTNDYYKSICTVTQNSRIFSGTVYENVTGYDSSIKKERVMEALQKTGLNRWVNELPQGVDTVLESGMLSSGQEQLLYISRAFLSDASVYIFDEINSRLDESSEDKIIQALKELTFDKTVLIIAHKLKMLDLVDNVLVLENGKIKLFDKRDNIPNEVIERNLDAWAR